MNKQEIYQLLTDEQIHYEVTEHEAVYNMADLSKVELPYPNADAKNLFVRDDKKQHYYLITISGDKRVNLKDFRKNNRTRPLSFAPKKDLQSLLGLEPGSVTPLGLLNDTQCQVEFYLDESFLTSSNVIGVHPNENTATVWLNAQDLLAILQKHGTIIHIVTI